MLGRFLVHMRWPYRALDILYGARSPGINSVAWHHMTCNFGGFQVLLYVYVGVCMFWEYPYLDKCRLLKIVSVSGNGFMIYLPISKRNTHSSVLNMLVEF